MGVHPLLKTRLEQVALRERRLRVWWELAIWWACVGCIGLILARLNRHGIKPGGFWPLLGLGLVGALVIAFRSRRKEPDWRKLAWAIEAKHSDLDGRLLTAVEQPFAADADLSYLQQRLIAETLRHSHANAWSESVPESRLQLARSFHWLALGLFAVALMQLHTSPDHGALARNTKAGVTVTPGDTTIERGTTLVILARFGGALPRSVEVVIGDSAANKRVPLVKSLADPMFGASLPEVSSNFLYHLEYAGQRTRDFKVTVFEYPRLEQADADVAFPEYTGQAPKHIANTRRVSAVEGSRLELALRFNKEVATARLVSKDKERRTIPCEVQKGGPSAALRQFPLELTQTYELQLVDADGRTNKVPAQFVFQAMTNRAPEIHLASPRGDQRPSPLEEISFEGTVWDDFGVKAYGIGYTVAGQEPKWVELGQAVPGGQKKSFQYMLRLEELDVQRDQLLSWFVWADDIGPDGKLRRTSGDLFFGEVRPFEEVFREGQGMEGQGNQSGQQGGESQSAKLTELQKQIISATWKLQRDPTKASQGAAPTLPEPQSKNQANQPNVPEYAAIESGNSRIAERRSSFLAALRGMSAMPIYAPDVMAQLAPAQSQRSETSSQSSGLTNRLSTPDKDQLHTYTEDAIVVRDAQAQALDQAQTALEKQRDSRAAALWRAAAKEMERALARLQASTNSPTELKEALASEQSAYQALLRLQEHEYQVARSRGRSQSGGRSQQMQRQLQELDLSQTENRYETQSEAQRPQPSQRREQLQVMNRLQELARRQQDLNDRLKELQTALQEAKTDEERAEIQRRLKRLQEEEQQMLADVDEVRQRMDRPENQSRMADERRQLDETRNEVQRAAESAGQGSASEAMAAGTRAQQQLQQARDQMRKENSSQFAEDLRQMRSDARELAREQDRLQQQMDQDAHSEHKSLSGSTNPEEIAQQFGQQKQRMTNLVERATQVSQQAEEAEPLLSRQLYDTVRKFTQDTTKGFKDLQDGLLNRGLMTRELYERLKESSEPDSAKLLEMTADLANRHLSSQASQVGQHAQAGIENLKRGVERAAESVLGDDTEALRLAQQELNQLTEELQREMSQSEGENGSTNRSAASSQGQSARAGQGARPADGAGTNLLAGEQSQIRAGEPGSRSGTPARPSDQEGQSEGQSTDQASASRESGTQPGEGSPQQRSLTNNTQGGNGEQSQTAQDGQGSPGARGGSQRLGGGARDWAGGGANGGDAAEWNGNLGGYLNRFLNDGRLRPYGPLTGEDFVPWADRLRDVEEMIEEPAMRNEVAVARERARVLRQHFKTDRQKPDWAVVRLQVFQPLVDVRNRIADELARRESREALVPIDRDPVPERYSELVRKYYEQLGKDK